MQKEYVEERNCNRQAILKDNMSMRQCEWQGIVSQRELGYDRQGAEKNQAADVRKGVHVHDSTSGKQTIKEIRGKQKIGIFRVEEDQN